MVEKQCPTSCKSIWVELNTQLLSVRAKVPMVSMMWFKRDPKVPEKGDKVDGMVNKLRRKKPVILKPTRESSERETSADSDKERRRYSDILDMKVSLGTYLRYLIYYSQFAVTEVIVKMCSNVIMRCYDNS